MPDLVRCGGCGTAAELRDGTAVSATTQPIRGLCVGGRTHGPWLTDGSLADLPRAVAERVVMDGAARGRDRGELTVKAAMTLDLEELGWRYAGAKETTIRYLFSESATRYYQRLQHIMRLPGATMYAPHVVARLTRLRDARLAARSARRLGFEL